MSLLAQEGNDRNFMLIAVLSLIFMLNNRQRRSLLVIESPVSDLPQASSSDEHTTDEDAEVFYDEGKKEETYEILQVEPADDALHATEAEIYGYSSESEENSLEQEDEKI